MSALIRNAFSEKIRSRTFYIVAFIGMVLMLLITTSNDNLSINGRKVTGFEPMVPVALAIMGFVSCLLAVMISIQTIPNEFERKTIHLVLVRGIKPGRYMFALTIGNILASVSCQLLLTISLYIFCICHGKWNLIPAILLSTLLMTVNTAFLSAAVSLLSIKLPVFVAGISGILLYVTGMLRGVLYILAGRMEGITALPIKGILFFIPDFSAVQSQAAAVLVGNPAELQPVAMSLLLMYAVLSLTFVTFRKEV